MLMVGAAVLLPASSALSAVPELPRVTLDTSYIAPTGNTINVPAGGNLQTAINSAQPGDIIRLAAGATFAGNFTLPKKTGTGWITITTSSDFSRLPAEGSRVHPSYSTEMPKVQGVGTVLTADAGAHNYRFMGVEIRPTPGNASWNLITIGDGGTTERPHDMIFDRCFIHGDPVKGTTRGIALNGNSIAVVDSYMSDFKAQGNDSQALCGWNGDGPYKIANNYLEGAGENIMFGGSDPAVAGRLPSDIQIINNSIYKPRAWKIGDPRYKGTPWTVKNLLELKIAQRVLIEGNIIEQSWPMAQIGFAVSLKVANQSGTAPWSTTQDVTFRKNLVQHAAEGVNVLGKDSPNASVNMARVSVNNNVFQDIGTNWGGRGIWMQMLSGTIDFTVDHNTTLQNYTLVTASGDPHTGFVFTNNIAPHNLYGFKGDGVAAGQPTLDKYFPGGVVSKNAIIGGSDFKTQDYSPANVGAVGFVDYVGGNLKLSATSPYRNAGTDGLDVGVDWDAMQAAIAKPRAEMNVLRSLGTGSHSIEMRGIDMGAISEGFIENLALDQLILHDSAKLHLVDAEDNGNRAGAGGTAEALYVNTLTINAGSTLDLNGLHLYFKNGGAPKQLFPGDANLDGLIDMADYAPWFNNYGANGGWTAGDFTGDGMIDMADYAIWFNGYGAGGASGVPEPATLALLALGGLAVIHRRMK